MELQSVIKARFNEIYQKVAGYKDLFPQKTKLRLELPIENGQGRYVFDLKEHVVNHVSTFGLNRNDVLVPNAVGILISIGHTVNGTYVEKLYSYAPKNDGVNPSVDPVGFTSNDIDNLYNGNVQWLVGTTQAWEAYPMEDFLKIPRQQGAFVLNNQDAAVQEGIRPEFHIEDCLTLLMPKYYIAGTQDHKITVNFDAAGLTFNLNDNNYTAKLVLYMDAFLIKNGTQLFNSSADGPFKEASGAWS